LGGALLIALFLLAVWSAPPAAGVTPPGQDGRPTLPPPPPPGPSGGEPDGGGGGLSAANCAGLRGTVINWGYQNEPGVALRLRDGGWEATQVTSTDGAYAFGSLGEGVAFLSVELAPEQAETLRPMADEIAVRLRCDLEVVANIGLYSSAQRPDPPATISMSVSDQALLPGETATFYLTVRNGMPHAISRALVTDYLPDGLIVNDVIAPWGTLEILNQRMVVVNIGELPAGEQGTIEIDVQAAADAARGARLTNTATLLYAESAADQAWATLSIGAGGAPPAATEAPAPAATQAATPAAGATPTAAPATPAPDETAHPDDEMLPTTGGAVTLAVLSVGFVLAMLLAGLRARPGD
jgi:uncharacterized repeat protein (TIGR01451 family)